MPAMPALVPPPNLGIWAAAAAKSGLK